MTGDLGGPRVLGVVEAKLVIVDYRDGATGKTEQRVGALANGVLVFFRPDMLSNPAQKWMVEGVEKFVKPTTPQV